MTPELTVIVPTRNERPNVEPLFTRLEQALCTIRWEVIFVDDNSPDRTADAVRGLAADLQHDVAQLPIMLRTLREERIDVVVASRERIARHPHLSQDGDMVARRRNRGGARRRLELPCLTLAHLAPVVSSRRGAQLSVRGRRAGGGE